MNESYQAAVSEQAAAEKTELAPAQVEKTEVVPEPVQETAEQIAAKEAEATLKAEKRQARRERKDYYEMKAKLEYLERELGRNQNPKKPNEDDGQVNVEELVEKKLAERDHQRQIQDLQRKRDDVVAKAEKSGDFDFEDFVDSVEVTPVMRDTILDSDTAPELLKYLYKNPEDASRIANLPLHRQAAEIGKLELKINEKPAVKKSSAPAPISPIGGKKSGDLEYRADMSDEEYDKWTAQERKKLRG